MNNGIIYRGPSRYDGAPIVVVALWSNRNRKTGGMVQTYILRDDINPLEASKTGADASICGDCIHRGIPTDDPIKKQARARTCYVNLGQGPTIVYKALARDFYPDATSRGDRRAIGAGRMVRIGTYGDPACVPVEVWNSLLSQAAGWTAYTHKPGWQPSIAMQSADTLAQAQEFWAAGSRTFRVVSDISEIVPGLEVLCPASKEAGKRTTCAACKLCAGTATKSAKSIAIPFH